MYTVREGCDCFSLVTYLLSHSADLQCAGITCQVLWKAWLPLRCSSAHVSCPYLFSNFCFNYCPLIICSALMLLYSHSTNMNWDTIRATHKSRHGIYHTKPGETLLSVPFLVGGEGDRALKKQHLLGAFWMGQALLGTFPVILISTAALSLSAQNSPNSTSSLSALSASSILIIHRTYKLAQHPSSLKLKEPSAQVSCMASS